MRFFILILLLLTTPAFAQAPGGGKSPVEIEASHQLEWLRDQNMYRASGDVTITQGTTTIRGDNAEAAYDPQKGSSALTVITVIGNVVITDLDRVIHADKAVYDTATENLLLTGGKMSLTSPDFTVTAHDNMQYNAREHMARAIGNAEIVSKTQKINADTITAWLDPKTNKLAKATASGRAQIVDGVQKLNADNVTASMDQAGSAMQNAQANGHIVMSKTTPNGTDIAMARQADYDVTKKVVVLKGDVKITQGSNHMQGDQATIDMATGRSSLTNLPGDKGSGGRVKAIFSSAGTKSATLEKQ